MLNMAEAALRRAAFQDVDGLAQRVALGYTTRFKVVISSLSRNPTRH